MKLYWANAKTADLELLSTSEGCLSISEAIEQFQVWWECGFNITEMWVEECEGRKKIRDIKINSMVASEVE